MKKQLKKLELRTECILSLSAMKSLKGGYTLMCQINTITGVPNLMTSVGAACPTLAQGNTVSC